MNLADVYNAFFEGAGFSARSVAFVLITIIVGVLMLWIIISSFQKLREIRLNEFQDMTVLYKTLFLMIVAFGVLIAFISMIYKSGFPLSFF